jgi:Putative phage abortive infection protein
VSTNKQQESQEGDTPFELGRFFYITVGVVFVTMLALYISQFGISRATDQAIWGAFGDFFGGTLNPLVSFFTLIVAVSVWKLQRLQLVATQKELEETREAIKVQTFDQFFMSVLASHRAMSEQVSLIGISGSNTLQTGKRAIDSYRNYLTSHEHYFDIMLKQKVSDTDGSVIREAEPNIRNKAGEALKNTFNVWKLPPDSAISMLSYFCIRYYKKPLCISNTFNLKPKSDELSFENIFGHIFRSTYQILKLIDEQFSKSEDKKIARRYVNLLRAQMSESEFVFFALSALTKEGKKSWARSVRLNFFEGRLQNSDWTQSLITVFKPSDENINAANLILKEDENAD